MISKIIDASSVHPTTNIRNSNKDIRNYLNELSDKSHDRSITIDSDKTRQLYSGKTWTKYIKYR